jgi:hypothetical protein
VHFVGCLYIVDLSNAQEMEQIKVYTSALYNSRYHWKLFRLKYNWNIKM